MRAARTPRRSYQDVYDAPWAGSLYRPLLIAILAASVAVGPLAILRAVTSWRLGYALPLAFAVSLAGCVSTIRLGRPRWRDRRNMLFRLGELVVLLLAVRLATWLLSTGLPTAEEAVGWLRHPGLFLDNQFVGISILLVTVWGLAIGMTGDFNDLAIQPDEIAAHESHEWADSRSQLRVFQPTPRIEITARFAARWLWGGLLVVLCAAVSQVAVTTDEKGLVHLGLGRLGLPPDMLAALLCYFLTGLLLMSQARLAMLRGQCYNEGVEIAPAVLRNWHVSSLVAVAAVAAAAALLPIGSTGWLATALTALIAFVIRAGIVLVFLLTLLVAALLSPLRFLFQSQGEAAPAPEQPALQLPTQAQMTSRLPDWLGGAVLWLVIGVLVGFLLLNYVRSNELLRSRSSALWIRIRLWWRARWQPLRRALSAAAGTMTAGLAGRLRRLGPRPGVAPRPVPIRPGALAPRERIRYFYLRAVARAADRGVTRPSHATPLEFAHDLEQQWPDTGSDVRDLTEAFLAARYDRRAIAGDEAQGAQTLWQRVMRALRGQPRREPGPEHINDQGQK